MPDNAVNSSARSDKPIWYFLICWTVLNLVQAYTLELHADEAYYWIYSRFLDWGYFDHPPMVALFIRAGDSLMHNELGLRIITILTSSASVYILWVILKKYAIDVYAFILVIAGTLIFHIYGFTTTPDAPLFFFAVLFYYCYQKYINEDKWWLALLLGVIIACMLYSKYHAVLLVAFTVASNIKLLKRPSFYLTAGLALVLYIPHILWQINHGYPSINYHLYERSAALYNSENSWLYVPGQLLMAGPIIGWFIFYSAFTIKVKDTFIRCLLVNGIGTFIFFFLATFRGETQPHWTLIAFAPLIMLALIKFKQAHTRLIWFYGAAIINMVLIVLFRLSIVFALPLVMKIGQVKSYFGFKEWAQVVHQKAGDAYVIMDNGFQNPSKYDYYTNTLKGFSYDSRYYRRTQFDIWPIEEKMQHTRAYYLIDSANTHITDSIKTRYWTWYAQWVNDVRTYQKVLIETPVRQLNLHTGEKRDIDLILTNPYPYNINFGSEGYLHEALFGACFFRNDGVILLQKGDDDAFHKIVLKPGASAHIMFHLVAPQKGKYDMIFSIRTTPFDGSKNSRRINLVVE